MHTTLTNAVQAHYAALMLCVCFMLCCYTRWLVRACITDSSGSVWVTMFNDAAAGLLRTTATSAAALLTEGKLDEYTNIFDTALFRKYVFKIRAKADNQQGEMTLRCQVLGFRDVEFAEEGYALIRAIQRIL